MSNKLKYGLLAALFVALTGVIVYFYIANNKPVSVIIFLATDEEKTLINDALSKLSPNIKKRIESIVVVEKLCEGLGGLCLGNKDGSFILLDRGELDYKMIWHEAYHAPPLRMIVVMDLMRIRGAPDKPCPYLGDEFLLESPDDYPKDGFLSSYGRSNFAEDIAVWGENIQAWLNGLPSQFDKEFDKQNPIYKEILGWFLKWGYISSEEHDKLLKGVF